MKLKELYVSSFKNLKNIKLFFSEDNLSVIIGNNGTGKSNVLEVISDIFSSIFIKSQLDIKCKKTCSLLYSKDNTDYHIFRPLASKARLSHSKQTQIKETMLPSSIITIYSGDNSRILMNYYKPILATYLRNIRQGKKADINIFFLDSTLFNVSIILLAAFGEILADNKVFLREKLNINRIIDVDVSYNPKVRSSWNTTSPITIFYDLITKQDFFASGHMKFSRLSTFLLNYGGEKNLFMMLASFLYGNKPLWENISFTFEDINGKILNSYDLSEGELKFALVRAAMEFVSDENSIVLLDEPDAHIHESRKSDLLNLLKTYSDKGRSIVMTTHSAIIADQLESKNIIFLDRNESGNALVLEQSKQTILSSLLSDQYSNSYTSFLISSKVPLLLVEGSTDIKYIKKAFELFDKKFKVDCIHFSGADNAKNFYDSLIPFLNKEKIVVFLFDRDDAGRKGMFLCCQKGDINIEEVICLKNNKRVFFTMLPRPADQQKGEFVIEDYFSSSYKLNLLYKLIQNTDGLYSKIEKDMRSALKKELSSNLSIYTSNEMKNFSILTDKIKSIINGECKVKYI